MKTAEEWIEQYQIGFVLKPSDIHRIQLDAFKGGMLRAAEICVNEKWTHTDQDCKEAILLISEQLTNKDL